MVVLCALMASLFQTGGLAADASGFFTVSNMEINVYPKNSLEPEAVWKINTVSPEHKRIGFFSIKLLPVMVAAGIQLEFTKTNPQTDWLEGFHGEWMPTASQSIFEWRDFSIFFPQEKLPRLHAKYVHPVTNAGSLVCRLDGVTLQSGSGPVHLSSAEVRADGQGGKIVWRDSASTIQWDLFSGQFETNATMQVTQK